MPEKFLRRVELPLSAEQALAWHERPGAFERLLPPWENVQVVDRQGTIRSGDRTRIRLSLAGMKLHWLAEHYDYQPDRQFADRQLSGPFAEWNHVHRFLPAEPGGCVLEDDIAYRVPGGWLGKLLGGAIARGSLERMFTYRHRTVQDDMNAHAKFAEREPLTIAITGASGLVGSALAPLLTTGGHRVVALSRAASKTKQPSVAESGRWDPATGEIESSAGDALDAVVHLAGENIAGARWNARRKQAIRDSRVGTTQRLCESLARRATKPSVLICASATGYYGSRGDDLLTEESVAGVGFLPEVCREWEAATQPAVEAGIRVVNVRLGIILSPKGGALAKMLTPFRLGAGGVVGSGKQYWSWIALDDVIGAMHHCLLTDSIHGPVNATAPNPVTNREFTKTLGQVLHRPTIVPLPAFAARLALGEMADDLLLSSSKVMPSRLIETGYAFRFPQLEGALRHLLGAT